MVNTDPKLELQFIGERSQDQNITRMVNPSEDYIYVIQGTMKIIIENTSIEHRDPNLVIELHSGDFVEPSCPLNLNYFKTKRLLQINKSLREQRVKQISIRHNVLKRNAQLFFIPSKYHRLYTRNKNYLSVFSKDQIDKCLLECFPQSVDLQTEKRKKHMKEIIKFDILAPNSVLTLEGQAKVPIAYFVLFGNIRVFKHDSWPDSKQRTMDENLP